MKTMTMEARTMDQMIAGIQALDLDAIKFKAMDAEEGYGWSREQADANEVEYKRFLTLLVKYPETTIAPNKTVDKFWHAHILDTMKYAEDCQNVFGYFLHHFPYFGMRGAQDATNLAKAGADTARLYQREFGVADRKQPAYCGATSVSYCGATSAKIDVTARQPAYCGAASVSYCGATSAEVDVTAGQPAYCGAASVSYCGATSAKINAAAEQPAYCGAASVSYCGATSAKVDATAEQPAYCGAASVSYCGATSAKVDAAAEQPAYCGATVRPGKSIGDAGILNTALRPTLTRS